MTSRRPPSLSEPSASCVRPWARGGWGCTSIRRVPSGWTHGLEGCSASPTPVCRPSACSQGAPRTWEPMAKVSRPREVAGATGSPVSFTTGTGPRSSPGRRCAPSTRGHPLGQVECPHVPASQSTGGPRGLGATFRHAADRGGPVPVGVMPSPSGLPVSPSRGRQARLRAACTLTVLDAPELRAVNGL